MGRLLKNGAQAQPGSYQDPATGERIQGDFITADNTLASAVAQELKDTSERRESETQTHVKEEGFITDDSPSSKDLPPETGSRDTPRRLRAIKWIRILANLGSKIDSHESQTKDKMDNEIQRILSLTAPSQPAAPSQFEVSTSIPLVSGPYTSSAPISEIPFNDQTADNLSEVFSLDSVSDLMSLFSDPPSLTSDTTYSSLGSPLNISDATNELVQLLLLDEKLGRLLSSVFQRTAVDKIERNYKRLLRRFAVDLEEEAQSPMEQHVARLVKFRARMISQTLIAATDPSRPDRAAQMEALLHRGDARGGRIEGYLQSLVGNGFVDPEKTMPQTVDSDDGNSSDGSDDEVAMPNLCQLKEFILSSNALATLRTRLKDFISSEPGQEDSEEANCPQAGIEERISPIEIRLKGIADQVKVVDQETISAWFNATLKFFRPRTSKGHQRITWVCGCGKPMYSDVQELREGGAAHLEQELRRAAAAAATKGQAQSTTTITITTTAAAANNDTTQGQGTATQRQGTSSSSSSSTLSGSTLAPGSSTNTTNASPLGSTQNGKPSSLGSRAGPPGPKRFLILCVNGPRLARYRHLSVLPGVDDQVLFQDIRRSYANLRRDITRSFHPDTPEIIQALVRRLDHVWNTCQKLTTNMFRMLKLGWLVWWLGDDVFFVPKSAQFVRFQLVPVKMAITPRILECCLPPQEEVVVKRTYHYAPCPPDVRDQALGLPFLHVLLEPGNHLDDFWTNHMPKKLKQELEYQSGPDPVVGWGLHIVEGPNWYALAVLAAIFVVMSLALALVYSFVRSDVSSGFAVGSFMLAAETLVMTLILAVIVTSISQRG